jgi:GntR family transcriptional repressor for pyruvate dehydrogenase complex
MTDRLPPSGTPVRAPLRQVRRVSVVDEIVEQMRRRIISGEWPPGSVLPSLRTFAVETGVSMLSVREAIRMLQVERLVETRQGVGTFVLSSESETPWMLGGSDVDEFLDLTEAREVLEGAILRFAIERRRDDQLAQLEAHVERMRLARCDAAAFLEADAEFHVALAEAAQNRVLLHSLLSIRGPLKRLILNRTLAHLAQAGHLDEPIADHAEIVRALRDRSADHSLDAFLRITGRARAHLAGLVEQH